MMYNDIGLKERNDSELVQTHATWMAWHNAIWGCKLVLTEQA